MDYPQTTSHCQDLEMVLLLTKFPILKTSFLRKRRKMSQVDFQDFSDFAPNGYSSTPGKSTSKNRNLGSRLP